jgi:TPR repeat protein
LYASNLYGDDLSVAREYSKRAAEQGEPYGHFFLGVFSLQTQQESTVRAVVDVMWDSAVQGCCPAIFPFGLILFGLEDPEQGSGQLMRLTRYGWPELAFLGGLGLQSMGEERHETDADAAELFRAGADGVFGPAQGYYALALENGVGVNPNQTQAAEWYRKAVDQGYSAASLSLERCRKTGL